MITIKNTDTGITKATVSDSQGRYTVPELNIGTYEVDVESSGFKKVVHGGIVLSIGTETVVDISLEVGTIQQTVTVEADVSHVETTSAAISSLVEQKQLVDLPLNGRNFVNLVALQPGVVPTAASGGSFYGNQSNNAIGGYRPSGTAYLLDDTPTSGWWGHAPGNGSTGTTLGIDSIAEFQTLTNTYSAQFGGAGAAVNSSSKSGTNSMHGTVYYFIRNTAIEAENLYVPTALALPAPVLNRNQYGASLGGPIKKNKAFYFLNYEGVRIAQSSTNSVTTPDLAARGCPSQAIADADGGFCALDTNGVNPSVANNTLFLPACGGGNSGTIGLANFPASAYSNGDPCTARKAIAGVMSLTPWDNLQADNPTAGTATFFATSPTYTTENYVLARFDYTLSDKDTFFARYLSDTGRVDVVGNEVPTSISSTPTGLIPQIQLTSDNFATIEERHIFSPTLLNTAHFAFTRPNDSATQYTSPVVPASVAGNFTNCGGCPANQPLWFFPPELGGETGNITGIINGATSTLPYYLVPNGFRWGDDMVWTKGAHSLKFGGEIDRLRDNSFAPFTSGGSFAPTTVGQSGVAGFVQGFVNSSGSEQIPASFALAEGQPYPDAAKDFREMQYAIYAQDDWKASRNLTINLGIRFDPTNDAPIVRHLALNTYGAFSNLQGTDPECQADLQTIGYYPINCGFVPVTKIFAKNVSLHNIDPRIGIAWDPFKDHKTSVRAGFGITHVVLSTRDINYWLNPPDGSATVTFNSCTATGTTTVLPGDPPTGNTAAKRLCQAGTPYGYPFAFAVTPCTGGANCVNGVSLPAIALCTPTSINSSGCTSAGNSSDYTQCCSGSVYQWNATVQREVMAQTIVSLGYVGSRGIHLITEADYNPVQQCGTDPSNGLPIYINPNIGTQGFSAGSWVNCNRLNPAYGSLNYETNQADSWYNSMQVSVNRRFSRGFQVQGSYTYSKTLDDSSGGYGLDGGGSFCNPHNWNYCKGPSSWNRTHNFHVSAVYTLPFHKNELVSGWQLSGNGVYLSGSPFSVTSLSRGGGGTFYPNLVAGCDPYTHVSAQQAVNRYVFPQSNTGQYPYGAGASIVSAATNPYLNANCFTLPPAGEYGNVGRDAFTGPGSWDIDLSIFKDTKIPKISENFVIQFRAEFYNVLNHPTFANPSGTLWSLSPTTGGINGGPGGVAGTPAPCVANTACSAGALAANYSGTGFGEISTLTSTPRQMQFGLRVSF